MGKLRAFLLIMVVFIGTSVATAESLTMNDLRQAIVKLNSSCPSSLGEGLTMESITIDDTAIVANILSDESDEVIKLVAINAERLGPSMAKSTGNSKQMKEIFRLCKANNIDYKVIFYNATGARATLLMRYTDM